MVSRDGAGAVAEYVDEVEEKTCVIPAQSALMFCYFNNNQYFHKYLDQYQGLCCAIKCTLDNHVTCAQAFV